MISFISMIQKIKKKETDSEIQRTILVIARGEGVGRTGRSKIVEGD